MMAALTFLFGSMRILNNGDKSNDKINQSLRIQSRLKLLEVFMEDRTFHGVTHISVLIAQYFWGVFESF